MWTRTARARADRTSSATRPSSDREDLADRAAGSQPHHRAPLLEPTSKPIDPQQGWAPSTSRAPAFARAPRPTAVRERRLQNRPRSTRSITWLMLTRTIKPDLRLRRRRDPPQPRGNDAEAAPEQSHRTYDRRTRDLPPGRRPHSRTSARSTSARNSAATSAARTPIAQTLDPQASARS